MRPLLVLCVATFVCLRSVGREEGFLGFDFGDKLRRKALGRGTSLARDESMKCHAV